jgi:hypothetical protein
MLNWALDFWTNYCEVKERLCNAFHHSEIFLIVLNLMKSGGEGKNMTEAPVHFTELH